MGGLGAIRDEIIITVTLSGSITEQELVDALTEHGTRVEFGSDAAFLTGELVPTPGAVALLGVAGLFGRRRRRC
jgi:MYXO-CTERM domain-containing protein